MPPSKLDRFTPQFLIFRCCKAAFKSDIFIIQYDISPKILHHFLHVYTADYSSHAIMSPSLIEVRVHGQRALWWVPTWDTKQSGSLFTFSFFLHSQSQFSRNEQRTRRFCLSQALFDMSQSNKKNSHWLRSWSTTMKMTCRNDMLITASEPQGTYIERKLFRFGHIALKKKAQLCYFSDRDTKKPNLNVPSICIKLPSGRSPVYSAEEHPLVFISNQSANAVRPHMPPHISRPCIGSIRVNMRQ